MSQQGQTLQQAREIEHLKEEIQVLKQVITEQDQFIKALDLALPQARLYAQVSQHQQKLKTFSQSLQEKQTLLNDALDAIRAKNELLFSIKIQLEEALYQLQGSEKQQHQRLIRMIEKNLQGFQLSATLVGSFERLFPMLVHDLHKNYPKLNSEEILIITLLKLENSTEELAWLLGLSGKPLERMLKDICQKMKVDGTEALEKMIKAL